MICTHTMALLLYATLIGASEMIPPVTHDELARMFNTIGQLSDLKEREP